LKNSPRPSNVLHRARVKVFTKVVPLTGHQREVGKGKAKHREIVRGNDEYAAKRKTDPPLDVGLLLNQGRPRGAKSNHFHLSTGDNPLLTGPAKARKDARKRGGVRKDPAKMLSITVELWN